MTQQRTIRVVDRSGWGTTAPYPMIRVVTVDWVCPRCGKPRGEPWSRSFYENDQSLTVSCWYNECGHVDHYTEVLKEARFTRRDRRYQALETDSPTRWLTFAVSHPQFKPAHSTTEAA